MIEVKNVTFSYGKNRPLIREISAEFCAGKMHAIFGASGCGKSTFLSLLGGLREPQKGEICVDGVSVYPAGMDRGLIRREFVSYIFQNFMLLPYLTAYENIQLALEISNIKKDNDIKYIQNILSQLGIDEDTANRKVKLLSGGEQQRIVVARALAIGAKYILADEPTGNLDKENTINLIKLFKKIIETNGVGVVVVTHSDLVRSAADISYELDDGTLAPYSEREIVWD